MAYENFMALCTGLCAALGTSAPELTYHERGTASLAMQLDGVNVTLAHFPQTNPDCAVALLELGVVPAAQELAVWLALMNINFLMRGDGDVSFGRNPHDGAAILQCAYPLHDVTDASLKASLERMVRVAHSWRQDFFLGDTAQAGSASVEPARAGVLA